MFPLLLLLGLTFELAVGLSYSLYVLLVLRNSGITGYSQRIRGAQGIERNLSNVSIIVSTFQEAEVIQRKLENIAALNYPKEKLKVIVIDDNSKDGTAEIADTSFKNLGLNGIVIRNPERIGLNASLNLAIREAKDQLICVSDVDVSLDRDSLRNSVLILEEFDKAGGVTGHLVPVSKRENIITRSEETYREYYDRAMLAESSLHSAFPGNGTLIVFKKSLLSTIPEAHGSSDGNIAIGIVKNGCRFLYVPSAIVRETVPETPSQQRLQKVRRARRLIEVFLYNRDVLFNKRYGSFGKTIFPLKFLMYVLSPILLFLGFALIIVYVALAQDLLLCVVLSLFLLIFAGLLLFPSKVKRTAVSFVLHNLYLVLGLLSLPKRSRLWKKVERK